jgi:hypothetical protein
LFALCISVISLLVASAAAAETRLKLETHYDDRVTSEGYSEDLDVLFNALSDTPENSDNRYWYHWYDHGHSILIADVGVHVYADSDGDGYFTHFSVSFDIDVSYGSAWVYALVYLRDDQSEYRLFHTTEVFEVYEHLGSDRYEIESKLVANYPAGHYDVLIEVYEAGDAELRDSVSGAENRNLFAIPLESGLLDDGPTRQVVHASVGSWNPLALAVMTVLGWLRYHSRRRH